MKYEVGDTVLLLHSSEEGTVVEIMSENMVMVNVQGIEFPVFMDQIDFPYFKRFSDGSKKKKEAEARRKIYIDQIPKERKTPQNISENGVHFSFVPVYDTLQYEDHIEYFKLFLLNQNGEAYHFEYCVLYKDAPDFVITNEVAAHTDFYLHNISQEELNDIIKFQFHFSLAVPDKNRADQYEKNLKLKAKTLFQKIDEMHQANVPSFAFDLFNKYPARAAEPYFPLPEKKPKPVAAPDISELARSVVDLHIEKITGNHFGMSNYEIMQIQLNYFEKYYRLAIANMQPKLIVIHGIGSGKLRSELHERLNSKREVRSFVNQYHANYGFGATEIYFQY